MSECKIHFLNVGNGDCIVIEHETGRVSVIDVCKAKRLIESHYNNKQKPTNPVEYIKSIGVKNIFRFILTHPDMDHMDGIKALFDNFSITNFWDTDHNKEQNGFDESPYNEKDWEFYQSIRSGKDYKVLRLYNGCDGLYYKNDGLCVISPTKKMIKEIKNKNSPNWNEISYVILHKVFGRKILYCGDSGDLAWKHIMDNVSLLGDLRDIDILVAPHHGRKSGGDSNNTYIDKLNPKLVLFGNAESSSKNYGVFSRRGIPILTNNEAGDIILTIKNDGKICVKMTRNSWVKLSETKNENMGERLRQNSIYIK